MAYRYNISYELPHDQNSELLVDLLSQIMLSVFIWLQYIFNNSELLVDLLSQIMLSVFIWLQYIFNR